MRRRALRIVAGLTVLATGVLVVMLRPVNPINRESAARIRKGMTMADVDAILGRPTDPARAGRSLLRASPFRPDAVCRAWADDDAAVIVHFGPDGRTVAVQVIGTAQDEGLPHRLRL